MAAGSTYTPIATTTLGSSANSYTFSSIPSTYTDLYLVMATNETVANSNGIILRFNSDSGSNYSTTYLYGNGSSAASSRESNTTRVGLGWLLAPDSTNLKAIYNVNIMNYSNTTTYKTVLNRGNNAGQSAEANVSTWRNTAAISSITVATSSAGNDLNTGTVLTLYGIQAA